MCYIFGILLTASTIGLSVVAYVAIAEHRRAERYRRVMVLAEAELLRLSAEAEKAHERIRQHIANTHDAPIISPNQGDPHA